MTRIKWTPYLACAYAEGFNEGEDATAAQKIAAFQYIIDNDLLAGLQGWYGATATQLINAGYCHPKRNAKSGPSNKRPR